MTRADARHGAQVAEPSLPQRRKGLVLMAMGFACLVAALTLFGTYTWEDYQIGRASSEVLGKMEQLDPSDACEPEGNQQMPYYTIDGINYLGRIQIPSVGIDLPVIADYSMEALQTAPARYSGDYYANNMVICGHSFMWQFGPLHSMRPGDDVYLLTADDKVLHYRTMDIEIVGPYEVDRMTKSEYDLSLFCCTWDSANRITPRCMRVYD